MSRVVERRLGRALYRWRIACGFCAVAAFTVIVGYHLPLRRELVRLRAEQASSLAVTLAAHERERIEREIRAAREQELTALRRENERLGAALAGERRQSAEIARRIEDLGRAVSERFGAELRAQRLAWANAADRVSVAVAMPALFPAGSGEVGKEGRALLCELADTIMARYGGQIRVTGYYGAGEIKEPALARAYATPWELSAARAATATAVLERDCKAARQRFLAVGYGPRSAGALGPNVAFEFVMSEAD